MIDVYTLKCIQLLPTQNDTHIHTKARDLEASVLIEIHIFMATFSANQCWISYIKQSISHFKNNNHIANATLQSLPNTQGPSRTE